jgi:hypothetical protein
MTEYVDMKCAICGYEWKIIAKRYDLYPYKICENCALIGPKEPAHFEVSNRKSAPSFLKDRDSIIVSEKEMHSLYEEYCNQLANVSRYLREKYDIYNSVKVEKAKINTVVDIYNTLHNKTTVDENDLLEEVLKTGNFSEDEAKSLIKKVKEEKIENGMAWY